MLNKIKNISVFIITTFYVLQLCTIFSGTLVEHLQEIRNQIQLSKIHLSEEKTLTLSHWKSLENKKEIKINNIYYDVLSYEVLSNKVLINAIKDKNENDFRIVLNNLFNKKESSPYSGKKKSFNTYNFITILYTNNYTIESNLNLLSKKSSFYTTIKNTRKVALTIYKPPC
jgi:hypothetical protein